MVWNEPNHDRIVMDVGSPLHSVWRDRMGRGQAVSGFTGRAILNRVSWCSRFLETAGKRSRIAVHPKLRDCEFARAALQEQLCGRWWMTFRCGRVEIGDQATKYLQKTCSGGDKKIESEQ